MLKFRALNIRSQLLLGFGSLEPLVAGPGGHGLFHALASSAAMRIVFEDRVVPLRQLSVLRAWRPKVAWW